MATDPTEPELAADLPLRSQIEALITKYRPPQPPVRKNSNASNATSNSSRRSILSRWGGSPKLETGAYDLVALSPSGQVQAAAVMGKLRIPRNDLCNIIRLADNQRVRALAASDFFIAVGLGQYLELYSSDATLRVSKSFPRTVLAVALLRDSESRDFVCIGTEDGKVYHSCITKKVGPAAVGEWSYKLAVGGGAECVEMGFDPRGHAVGIVGYSRDGSRICAGLTGGAICVFRVGGELLFTVGLAAQIASPLSMYIEASVVLANKLIGGEQKFWVHRAGVYQPQRPHCGHFSTHPKRYRFSGDYRLYRIFS